MTQSKDKRLFTPGPLTTSQTVKEAMLRDLGSHDFEFIDTVKAVREKLLEVAGVATPDGDQNRYEAILMQGSGTFGLEAVIASFTPPDGKWLIITNGVYGRRTHQIATRLGVSAIDLPFPESEAPDLLKIEEALVADPAITHVGVVHCETTSGIFNPIAEIGQLAKRYGKRYFVDAMSSFGAVHIDIEAWQIDYLVSSANKCIEGVPGFSFTIARRDALLETEGYARSVSLDLFAQWEALEANGNFRFTPPTHTILAFHQALLELEEEGGVEARATRYQNNHDTLISGMRKLGFETYLSPNLQGYIITTFYCPTHPNFDYKRFYSLLHEKGHVIYSGKVTDASCFRLGNIGHLYERDMLALLAAVEEVLGVMGVEIG